MPRTHENGLINVALYLGYMPRTREDCQEVEDTVCKSVQVTKYRKEIDQQCKTKVQVLSNSFIVLFS